MSKDKQTIYYATPTNMMAYEDGSIYAEWLEVVIVGILKRRGEDFYLVKTLDGSQTFTARKDQTFTKVTTPNNNEAQDD